LRIYFNTIVKFLRIDLKLIRVPQDVSFTKALEDIELSEKFRVIISKPLINMKPTVDAALDIIECECPKSSYHESADYRKPPLMLSRLGRGGKTTSLASIFQEVKNRGTMQPIYITFNANFYPRKDETALQALLRLIATELIDDSVDKQDVLCDKKALKTYLARSKKPIVLFIDELNRLGVPIDNDCAGFLREEFLDLPNRYLVYSTHLLMSLDITQTLGSAVRTGEPSGRKVQILNLPTSFDPTQYRPVFPQSPPSLQELCLHLGIPALIWSTRASQEFSPGRRFEKGLELVNGIQIDEFTTLKSFVHVLITGKPWTVVNDLTINTLSTFASISLRPKNSFLIYSSIDHNDATTTTTKKSNDGDEKEDFAMMQFPLVYIERILDWLVSREKNLSEDITENVRSLIGLIGQMEYCAKGVDRGQFWESLVQIALLQRCLYYRMGNNSSCSLFRGTIKDAFIKKVVVFQLDARMKTLEEARNFINKTMVNASPNTMVIFIPLFDSFPRIDLFFAWKNELSVYSVNGLQLKSGVEIPKKSNKPEWIDTMILIRGKASQDESDDVEHPGWITLSKNEIRDFVGCSLYPCFAAYAEEDELIQGSHHP
jgi:hypothetical protein